MQRTLTITALLLALSCPAFAGEMHTPVAAPTPTPTPEAVQGATTNSEAEAGAADSLAAAALNLLQSVLALL